MFWYRIIVVHVFRTSLLFLSCHLCVLRTSFSVSSSFARLQLAEFLKLWRVPECGLRTLPLLHRLKALAGIAEPKNPYRELNDQPGWWGIPCYLAHMQCIVLVGVYPSYVGCQFMHTVHVYTYTFMHACGNAYVLGHTFNLLLPSCVHSVPAGPMITL